MKRADLIIALEKINPEIKIGRQYYISNAGHVVEIIISTPIFATTLAKLLELPTEICIMGQKLGFLDNYLHELTFTVKIEE